MNWNEIVTKKKKPRQRPKPKEIRDVFTVICKTDLGVECVKEYRFHPKRQWRFDYAIPEHKIALEVEGGVFTNGRHVRPQGFLGDVDKYNCAALMGWKLFRVTPDTLYRTRTVNLLKSAINGDFDPQNDTFFALK